MLSVVNQRMENFDARAKAETEAALSQIAMMSNGNNGNNGNSGSTMKASFFEMKITETSDPMPHDER